jgi:metallo-beta-lactamase family protein
MTVSIEFLGAAGTVTGSKYLVRSGNKRILVDAGIFQGPRQWRERNWDPTPWDPESIDAVLLTHAHIDHTGMLPRFVSQGLRAPVFATKATRDLCTVLLPDSGRLQEEEVTFRRKHKASRHADPQPLYTEKDANAALALFKSVKFDERREVLPGVFARFKRMGHILGAASITLEIDGRTINFSGDIGRYDVPILTDPEPVDFGDLLLIESTYGDREHHDGDPKNALARVINEAENRGGALLIPSFAVGRTQLLLYYIRELKEEKRIPNIPVIIDSPMADDATKIYRENPGCYDEEAFAVFEKSGKSPFEPSKMHFTQNRDESITLNSIREPMILISASGMLTGGRVLHHLKHRISDPASTILFVGYQPPGGRGEWIQRGSESLRVFGQETPIHAHVETISGLSAHGDKSELLRWCQESSGTPGQVAVVHGESDSAKAFSETLRADFGWKTSVPYYRDVIEL